MKAAVSGVLEFSRAGLTHGEALHRIQQFGLQRHCRREFERDVTAEGEAQQLLVADIKPGEVLELEVEVTPVDCQNIARHPAVFGLRGKEPQVHVERLLRLGWHGPRQQHHHHTKEYCSTHAVLH